MNHKIQIIDLPALHAPILGELNAAISNVMTHQQFVNGPEVIGFEVELGKYLRSNVLSVGNGTDALEISLLALGIAPEDEVLVPSFSYFASAEVIKRIGAIPVFVDVNDSFTLDVEDALTKITKKTKAVIAVHLFGISADMNGIMEMAKSFDLKVVEDAAQAIGAECLLNGSWLKVGTIGHLGCLSFFPSKNLGAFGDGGAIITSDNQLMQKARMIAQHGQSSKYVHDRIGMNSRMDSLQAAILSVKLPYLDLWTKKRQNIAAKYKAAFNNISSIQLCEEPDYSSHVYHQFTMLVDGNRNKLLDRLKNMGVPARLYYPKAIHQQKAFLGYTALNLERTEYFQTQMISLPIHPTLSEDETSFIVSTVISVIREIN